MQEQKKSGLFSVQKIDENITLARLQLPDFATLQGISVKREIEKSGTVFLLEKLFGEKVELQYTAEGKPFIKGKNTNISITHSYDKLAIIRNDKFETGIDVELIRDKVLKIKDKFLCRAELKTAGNNVEKLIVYWAAKETLYKMYGYIKVDFVEHLLIESFELGTSGNLIGEIRLENFHKKVCMHYEKSEDYVLVYSLNEID